MTACHLHRSYLDWSRAASTSVVWSPFIDREGPNNRSAGFPKPFVFAIEETRLARWIKALVIRAIETRTTLPRRTLWYEMN